MTLLLTLTGAGGSGKTGLALEVAQGLVGAYPGGVWLVELAPLSEGALVPQAVAKAVKVPEQPGRPLTGALVDALREKRLLLILDNREHLKEEGVQLADVTCRWLGVGEWQPTSTRPSWNAEPRLTQEDS
jgi:predicted ATPase